MKGFKLIVFDGLTKDRSIAAHLFSKEVVRLVRKSGAYSPVSKTMRLKSATGLRWHNQTTRVRAVTCTNLFLPTRHSQFHSNLEKALISEYSSILRQEVLVSKIKDSTAEIEALVSFMYM